MPRLSSYLGISLALLTGILIAIFSGGVTVSPPLVLDTADTSSTTLSVLPGFVLPPIALPNLEMSGDTASASSTQEAPVPEKVVKPRAETPAATSTPSSPAPAPVLAPVEPAPAPVVLVSSGDAGFDAAALSLREALVNIICYAPSGNRLHSISGSGVFIDSKGIILTNAHVAQYFLLANRGVSCTIRSGGPAISKYKAALIYLPYAWVNANADILTKTDPIGTGEYDFALVAITASATSADLPTSYPSVPLAQLPPASGTPVVIASYGAQFLEAGQIQSSLYPTVVFGSVKDVYTFALNTIDILALGGSAAAQEGSSGGGVADASGTLIGTITTSTVQGETATRSLDAITASYIRSEYARETGSSLDTLLAKPVATAVSDFAPQISALGSVLTAQLP